MNFKCYISGLSDNTLNFNLCAPRSLNLGQTRQLQDLGVNKNYIKWRHTGAKDRGIEGFTLIELVVVVFIIGISSSIIFMSIGKGLLSREKGIVKEFYRGLLSARSFSIGSGRPVSFLIYSERREFGREDNEPHPIPEDVEIRGEDVEEYDDGIHAITFFPDGSSTGGIIYVLLPDGKEYEIDVSKFFGRIEVH